MSKNILACYMRCSTSMQETTIQKNDLVQYALSKGLEPLIYEDVAYSGTNTNRPSFQRMMRDAKARKFSAIVVWKLDRFGRSIKDLVVNLQELHDLKIDFISLKDGLDFSTASGRLMFHLVAAFAEFESATIRSRVQAGVRAKIAKTGKWGRAKKRDDDKILHLRAQGLSIRKIAAQLGIGATSVRRALASGPNTHQK
jgi:putative DNA-invertase from lambdoid prophage Rac